MVETLKKLTGDKDVAVAQPKKLFEEEEEEEEIQEDACFIRLDFNNDSKLIAR